MAVVQNPHTKNPKELWQLLQQQEDKPPKQTKFDEAGFENLRTKLAKNPRFIVK